MILVIDVGNTNTVLGVYDSDELIANWRMTTEKSKTADELGIFLNSLFEYERINVEKLDDVIISSVVPDVMYSLTHGIRKYFGIDPMIVSMGMKTGINIRMQNPKELGSDRIVNIVAAYATYGGPAIVIDYGTANTFDVINEKGEFITGITAPGIRICADALYQRAAQLPKFEIKNPGTVIAKNTTESMQVGIALGHVGETLYFIDRIKKELNCPDMKVIATGGLARVIDDDGSIFDVLDPLLTLKGLKILYEKNKRR
ncbi:MAG: type III pantothenate kinase [Lachnospiraceae bacterium]|nr:type III pantothenate kinase [Lachnospiraceae bacterium]